MQITITIPPIPAVEMSEELNQAALFLQRISSMAPDIVFGTVTIGDTSITVTKEHYGDHESAAAETIG